MRQDHVKHRLLGLDLVLGKNKVQPEHEENEPVADVSKHYPEQERESHSSEKGRVRLPVLGNSVGFYDFLG